MEYKDIYEELNKALWGDNGLLFKLRDPFHNFLGNLERSETLETIEIAKKFAYKLYLDTNDEYAIKTLELICQFIGESFINADVAAVGGTEYDPELMFGEIKPKDCKEPEPKKQYVVNVVSVSGEDNCKKEENFEFFFYADAKECMEEKVKSVRDFMKHFSENGDGLIDEERKFATKDNRFVVQIFEK